MKKTKYGDVYESLEELQNEDIEFVNEDDENYYIRLKPDGDYDNRMWKVHKKTGKVSSIFMTVYFSIEPSTRPVDITTFKKKLITS